MVSLTKDKAFTKDDQSITLRLLRRDWNWELGPFQERGTPGDGSTMTWRNLIAISRKLSLKVWREDNTSAQALTTTNQWTILRWDSRTTQLSKPSVNPIHSLAQGTLTRTSSFCQAFCKNNRNWNRDKNILKIRFWATNKMTGTCLETSHLIDMLFQEND